MKIENKLIHYADANIIIGYLNILACLCTLIYNN